MDVAGIQTHADPCFVVHEGDDVAQIFKGGPDNVTAPGHSFEDGHDGLGGCVCEVESFGDAGDRGGSWVATGPTGVEIVKSDAERFAAFEVVEEGVVSLSGLVRIFLGEVDEVGAVM